MSKYSLIFVILAAIVLIHGCQPEEQDTAIADQTNAMSEEPQAETVIPDLPDVKDNETVAPPADETEVSAEPDEQSLAPEESDPPTEPVEQPAVEKEAAPVEEEVPTPKVETTLGEETTPKEEHEDKPKTEKSEPKREKPAFYEHCKHIFTTYVDKDGNVDYPKLRRKRAELIQAARSFESIDSREYIFWSREEKIALWINAYNIFTLKFVIDHYPIQDQWYMVTYPSGCIYQIQGPSAWTKNYFKVMNIQYTLREIEREIILRKFKDLRTCFAFTYATKGGAFLRNEPYYPEKLEQQLDEQTNKFLKSPRGMRIDKNKKTVYLSDIFNWYRKEFAEKYADAKKYRDRPQRVQAYFNFIDDYASTEDIRCLESEDYTVEFLRYDWCLNEQKQK